MDKIHHARTETEQLPHAPSPHPWNQLEQQGIQHWGPRACRPPHHVHAARMEDGQLPKDILYGKLASAKRPWGCPQVWYKDACKRNTNALDIKSESWRDTMADRSSWRCLLHKQLKESMDRIMNQAIKKRTKRKENKERDPPATSHNWSVWGTDCHSCIGLTSHRWRCSKCSTMNS